MDKQPKLTQFLNKDENKNIKFNKLIRRDYPDGYEIDVDSLTTEQSIELWDIMNKESNLKSDENEK